MMLWEFVVANINLFTWLCLSIASCCAWCVDLFRCRWVRQHARGQYCVVSEFWSVFAGDDKLIPQTRAQRPVRSGVQRTSPQERLSQLPRHRICVWLCLWSSQGGRWSVRLLFPSRGGGDSFDQVCWQPYPAADIDRFGAFRRAAATE